MVQLRSRPSPDVFLMEAVIHPLVFLNISDHYTRFSINGRIAQGEVVAGCLMGTQVGRKTELFTSFEIKIEKNDVRKDYLQTRSSQISQCYPTYLVLGWYVVGSPTDPRTLSLHKKLSAATEKSLICLCFDPTQTVSEKQFMLFQFEVCSFHFFMFTAFMISLIVQDEHLAPISYKTEALEPERVAVATMDKIIPGEEQTPPHIYLTHLQSLQGVLAMLRNQVRTIIKFLKEEQKAAQDANCLCQISF